MTYKTEFPADYWPTDAEVDALLAAGFVDTSWHNNAAPSFAKSLDGKPLGEGSDVEIYIDAIDPELREIQTAKRFIVTGYQENCPEPMFDDPDQVAEFDTLAEALECAEEYEADIFHIINR